MSVAERVQSFGEGATPVQDTGSSSGAAKRAAAQLPLPAAAAAGAAAAADGVETLLPTS